jgi:hypothetical protein
MKGKGTGEPGLGMQALLSLFIVYPGLQSNCLGIHPSPALLMSKLSGHDNPSQTHFVLDSFGIHFFGQY